MKNTLTAIALIAVAFLAPLAVALYGAVASEETRFSGIAQEDAGYGYDYPTNLWEDY